MGKEIDKILKDIQNYNNISEKLDKLECVLLGVDKLKIKIPKVKKEDIKVGEKFYYYNTEEGVLNGKWILMEITYIRSGVIFYIDNTKNEEQWFPLGSVFANKLEYEIYNVYDYEDNKYKEYICSCPLTKLNYLKKK